MKHLIPVATAAILFTQTAGAQPWDTIETFGGAWDSSWGEVWVMPGGPGYEGTYTGDNGRFWLEFTDHVFEGIWVEDMSNERCATPYAGSYYWGRLELANSTAYPGFQMLWGYCDTGRIDKVWEFYERLPDGL